MTASFQSREWVCVFLSSCTGAADVPYLLQPISPWLFILHRAPSIFASCRELKVHHLIGPRQVESFSLCACDKATERREGKRERKRWILLFQVVGSLRHHIKNVPSVFFFYIPFQSVHFSIFVLKAECAPPVVRPLVENLCFENKCVSALKSSMTSDGAVALTTARGSIRVLNTEIPYFRYTHPHYVTHLPLTARSLTNNTKL